MNGRVKFFNDAKGFGFILAEDGKEYFVHITSVTKGTRLEDGQDVTFEVGNGPRGPVAKDVELVR